VADWIETCRGSVAPWECDITEHFTIAYYLDRIDQAATAVAEFLGLAGHLKAGISPRRFTLRFTRELRAGASFHVESAAIGLDPALRLGHRLIDSACGEVVTWIEEVWEGVRLSDAERTALGDVVAVSSGCDPTAHRPAEQRHRDHGQQRHSHPPPHPEFTRIFVGVSCEIDIEPHIDEVVPRNPFSGN